MIVIGIPAAVAIRQYFRSIKIAKAPSGVGHFRIADGARAYAAANSGCLRTYITDSGHIAI
jgi:hypothetical protein